VSKEFQIISRFVVANLPDSIDERRTLLAALLRVLPRNQPDRPTVFSMMKLLDRHLEMQQEFNFQTNSGNGE